MIISVMMLSFADVKYSQAYVKSEMSGVSDVGRVVYINVVTLYFMQ